jgi:hypothetical protein
MRNVRRGVSSFYSCSDELYGSSKLRYASREGEKVRQSIAYLRQHAAADRSTITTLQAGATTGSLPKFDLDGVQRDVTMQRTEPGTVIDIPKGLEYKEPPAVPQSNVAEHQALLAVASQWNVSAFLLTGEGDSASYASAVVAESPMMNNVVRQQRKFTDFWQEIYEAVVALEAEKGNLPEDVLEKIEIHVIAQNPSRDKKEAIESDKILADAGLMSDETFASRHGLDYDEEVAKGAQKQAMETPGIGGTQETPSGKLQAEAGSPPRANPR